MKKRQYFLYDTQDNEICMGFWDSAKDIADITKMKLNSVYAAICRGSKLRDRYEVVVIDEECIN